MHHDMGHCGLCFGIDYWLEALAPVPNGCMRLLDAVIDALKYGSMLFFSLPLILIMCLMSAGELHIIINIICK
jgi:hypothetical protein